MFINNHQYWLTGPEPTKQELKLLRKGYSLNEIKARATDIDNWSFVAAFLSFIASFGAWGIAMTIHPRLSTTMGFLACWLAAEGLVYVVATALRHKEAKSLKQYNELVQSGRLHAATSGTLKILLESAGAKKKEQKKLRKLLEEHPGEVDAFLSADTNLSYIENTLGDEGRQFVRDRAKELVTHLRTDQLAEQQVARELMQQYQPPHAIE